MDHLDCLGILDSEVLFVANGLHEILVNELSNTPPSGAVVHGQEMVTLSNRVSYNRRRAMTINAALLIKKAFDEPSIRDHECSVAETLKGEYSAKFLSPLRQPSLT